MVPLVKDLVKWDVVLRLSVPLQDSLTAFAEKLLSEESPDHIDAETCEALVKALTEEQRMALKRSLLNKVIVSNKPTHRIISRFANAISDCEVLGSKADDLIQEGFKKMLERGEIHEFEWMKRILQTCPQIPQLCPKDILKDFLERVQRHDKQGLNEESRKVLTDIQNVLEKLS